MSDKKVSPFNHFDPRMMCCPRGHCAPFWIDLSAEGAQVVCDWCGEPVPFPVTSNGDGETVTIEITRSPTGENK